MAARTSETVGKLALARARARLPRLVPESVEVVELVRGRAFVVVRMAPDGIVVLDEAGRLVRGRERLRSIAHHVRALAQVEYAFSEARLDRRLEHTSRSRVLLAGIAATLQDRRAGRDLRRVLDDLEVYGRRLEAVHEEWLRPAPATQRTLRRLVALLDAAARGDRAVIRGVRLLAAGLPASRPGSPAAALERWALARLGAPDLPFFYWELDEAGTVPFVSDFVRAARM